MTPLEILKKARRIIADPKRFAKGDYAFTKHGRVIDPKNKNASKFCSLGALRRCGVEMYEPHPAKTALFLHAVKLFNATPHRVNDSRDGRRKMLKVFDAAIAELRAKV